MHLPVPTAPAPPAATSRPARRDVAGTAVAVVATPRRTHTRQRALSDSWLFVPPPLGTLIGLSINHRNWSLLLYAGAALLTLLVLAVLVVLVQLAGRQVQKIPKKLRRRLATLSGDAAVSAAGS